MTKLSQITLLAAFTPLFAHAHSTSTSGSPIHALQHGALSLGYGGALVLAVVGAVMIIRKVRSGR